MLVFNLIYAFLQTLKPLLIIYTWHDEECIHIIPEDKKVLNLTGLDSLTSTSLVWKHLLHDEKLCENANNILKGLMMPNWLALKTRFHLV